MKETLLLALFYTCLISNESIKAQVDVVYNNLVWSDEFDTNGAINPTKWHHQTQLPNGNSWYNGEVQHYTNLITNSFVENGNLKIRAIKESFFNQGVTKQYTSARLNSKFAFLYGRVDIRAKIPTELGTWPALWLLGKNINEPGGFFQPEFGTTNWPACGEIDIMEHGITQSQPTGYIQSAIHSPSSFGNTVNHGGIIASNLGNDFHVYSMNWSPFQITFLLDGIAFYTYNPAVKNASTWPFDAEQYLLLNIAMGGVAGAIPNSFSQATMEVDYVRVYQNTLVDTEAPLNFTAVLGEITSSTVELLLNADDNSGTVVYNIAYGSESIITSNPSGVQKSVIVPNLLPDTNYVFTVSASDLAGNQYANNPIVLNATSPLVVGCSGTSNLAQQGSFSTGYNYSFETLGTDVKITFELLDTDKVGVVAFLWRQSPFTEFPMTNVSGNTFTRTITNQTIGSTISYAVKFAYAGGQSVTNYFSYVVGENCTLNINNFSENENFWFQNPVSETLKIETEMNLDKVEIFSLLGKSILVATSNFNQIDLRTISKGVYLVSIQSGEKRIIKKMILK